MKLPFAGVPLRISVTLALACAGGVAFVACSSEPDAASAAADVSSDAEVDAATQAADAVTEAKADVEPIVCDHPDAAAPPSDPGYRVVVEPTTANGGASAFPDPSTSWTLEYRFKTPPLPCSATWNHNTQVFYDWGDVDFDPYGANGASPISDYVFNQIVPQVMTGWALSGNDAGYHPSWSKLDSWVIQAQYFWKHKDGTVYDQAGPLVDVKPGDPLTTLIAYDATTGAITASISADAGTSSITIPKPFPNEASPPFTSWRTFFEAATVASGHGLVGRASVNVEAHNADMTTVCATLPFDVTLISLPGVAAKSTSYHLDTRGGLNCPGTDLIKLGF